jgi:hypothetical protein
MVYFCMPTLPPSATPAAKTSLFLDSTPLLGDPEALRARGEEEGYLFFKKFLPREPLLELRRQMLTICAERGWLAKGHDLMEGVFDMEAFNLVTEAEMRRTDVGVPEETYRAVQKLELFHTLPHHPKLMALYRSLFDAEVLPHPRHIARMMTGHHAMTPTPAHQDFIHIQGTPKVWTCWFPLGDCPRDMGGLTVLRGSHRGGVIAVKPAAGAGNLGVILCPNENHWVEGDYELGDILTFTSCTVHKALKSRYPDRMRLSCDIRFQPAEEIIHEGSLKPHGQWTWEELYEGWKNPDVQYYWKKHELKMSAWDPVLQWQKERICS